MSRARSGQLSRRQFLGLGAAAAVGGAVGGAAMLGPAAQVVERAFATDPAGTGSIADIDHVVLLMQENRSFDHYFGSMSGVHGFDDRSTFFRQRGWQPGAGPSRHGSLLPFRLDTKLGAPVDADIVNDPAHDWNIQHEVWNNGAMDRWVQAHVAADGPAAPMVMGYYTRADLPVHYALADAFTVCDQYFSSVLGPTAPNRLYWMSATLDPEGVAGGPILGHAHTLARGALTWRTFPENLQDAGVSWKIYNHRHSPNGELTGMVGHFGQFQDPESELHRRGIAPTYPADFLHDVATGSLPSVSWIIPSMSASEHPAYPAAVGADGIVNVLAALTANPALWERTALIVSYDENGGFFDHVVPPTAPESETDEFVDHLGQVAPIGLGFRVPCLVLSPYTRGGLVSSDVFDHTSQLQLVGTRFQVPVPNLTAWRQNTVGDMTSVFRGRGRASRSVPRFPDAAAAARAAVSGDHALIAEAGRDARPAYPVPRDTVPTQDRWPHRARIT